MTMCFKINKCYKQAMSYAYKIFLCISKLTVCQFLWFLVLLLLYILFILIRSESGGVMKMKSNNPVILWWTSGFPGSSETRHCPDNVKCDVFSVKNISRLYDVQAYLFYGSQIDFDDLPLPRQPKDIIWGVYHEESPRNVEILMHEPILNLFNFSSTYSRYSDIPFPLQYLESYDDITNQKYFVPTSLKNSLLDSIAPILYIQSDCETSTERDAYVKELMEISKIDSYGTCLNNKQWNYKYNHDYLNNLNEDEFLHFVARYKFVIAIENGACNDYVTEKFWRAIKVGSVPIYFGAPSIREWLPNVKSAILLEDFPTPDILNLHINQILENDNLYEEYLEHKIQQVVTNHRLIEEFKERPYQTDSVRTVEMFECYICKKIHDRHYGNMDVHIVSKKHYDCPKPISALTLAVNVDNSWVHSWEYSERKAKEIYERVISKI